MKKDIEWLKNEVNELPLRFLGFSMLKQREEFTVSKDDVLELINQLDEPEVLSQEWIDDNKEMYLINDTSENAVPDYKLRNLLVPKQELPVIPRFVAEWYESEGKRNSWWIWFYKWGRGESKTELETKTIRWMQDYNEEAFVNMFLHGYEVAEEQKYYVMNNDNRMMLVRMMDGKTITEADPFKLEDMYEGEKKSHRLTEQEIKDYDPRYFAFAVKVEELEE